MHRKGSPNKELSGPKCQFVAVEKPSLDYRIINIPKGNDPSPPRLKKIRMELLYGPVSSSLKVILRKEKFPTKLFCNLL